MTPLPWHSDAVGGVHPIAYPCSEFPGAAPSAAENLRFFGVQRPKQAGTTAKFAVFSRRTRKSGPETGSLQTASSAKRFSHLAASGRLFHAVDWPKKQDFTVRKRWYDRALSKDPQ